MRSPRFITLISLIGLSYLAWALLRPMPGLVVYSELPLISPQPKSLEWPAGGQAAIGAVGYGILAEHGRQKAVPMASTAKLLTALAILKQKPLGVGQSGPNLTVSKNDVAIYKRYLAKGGSVLPVKAGEQLSEYQALEAMLLPSANNIADSSAIWAFGSMTNFLNFATNYAKQLGLSDTHLADGSGFSPASVSTARDLTLLGIAGAQNPVIAQIASLKQANLPLVGTVHNVNWLLGVNGIDGIKTGNTDQAGGCYVFSATDTIGSQKLKLVGAVMGASNLASALGEGKNLSASSLANFVALSPVKAGQVVGHYQSEWGAKASVVASSTLSSPVWGNNTPQLASDLTKIPADTPAGHTVGQISWQIGDKTLTDKLVLSGQIRPPSLGWRLTHIY